MFALAVVGFGDEEEHARLIAPIKEALSPIVEMVTPIPYVGLQQMFDASAPWGMRSYEKAAYLAELTDGAIETILEHQAKKMSPCRSCRSSSSEARIGRPTKTAEPSGAAVRTAM